MRLPISDQLASKRGRIWQRFGDTVAYRSNKKAHLSLTNPRDACETIARFMFDIVLPINVHAVVNMALRRNVFEIFDVQQP